MGSCCSCQKEEETNNEVYREDRPLLANDSSINNLSGDASTAPKLQPQISSPQDKVAEIVNKTASSLVDIIATQQQQQAGEVPQDREEAYQQALEGLHCPAPPQPSLLADMPDIEQELNSSPLDSTIISQVTQTSAKVVEAVKEISVAPGEELLVQHLNMT